MDKEFVKYLLAKTKEDYNLIAEDFSRTRADFWPEAKFLFDDLKKGEKVLDLGSGNGRFYPLLKEAEYTGVDNSEKLVEIAKNKYSEADFQIADSFNLPFPDNYFDKIYSIAVFHHIPSKELRMLFLKEAKRVLKNQGRLVITVWRFHRLKEYILLLKYTILKLVGKFYPEQSRWAKLDFKDILDTWGKKTERYYHWFSKKELERLAKEAGFSIVESGIMKNEKGNRQNIYIILSL